MIIIILIVVEFQIILVSLGCAVYKSLIADPCVARMNIFQVYSLNQRGILTHNDFYLGKAIGGRK